MFKFTSLFFNNLFWAAGPVLAPTVTIGAGVYTTALGYSEEDSSLGTMTTSLGINAVVGLYGVYDKTVNQLQDTQAYVESLSEEELQQLIDRLETKEYFVKETDEEIIIKKKQLD